jgi:hypothetical protein
VRRRFQVFGRRRLWRLVCGALGGVVSVGDGMATGSVGTAAMSGTAAEPAALKLALTLVLSSSHKPVRSPIAPRVARHAADVAPHLRLSSSLAVRPGATSSGPGAPVPQVRAEAAAMGAPAGNNGLIVADGGRVIINAQGRDAVLSQVLNKDGIIRAESLESRNGEIWLGGGNSGGRGVSGAGLASGTVAGQKGGTVMPPGDKLGLSEQARTGASGVGAAQRSTPSPLGRESAAGTPDPQALRLTLALGSARKPVRRQQAVRGAKPVAEIALPLRLALSLVVRRGGAPSGPGAPPPQRAAAAVPSSAPRGSSPRPTTASDSAVEDDDSPEQPASGVGVEAAVNAAAPRRAQSSVDRGAAGADGSAESKLPSLEGEVWQMAPLRWTGSTGTAGNSLSGDAFTSMGLTNTLNVNASSYIVAPWLGTWSGGFARSSATAISSAGTSKTKTASSSNSVSGALNLVPTSAFPFSANFSHSMSEARAGQVRGQGSATTIGLTQKYRTNGDRDNYSARFGSSILRSGQDRSVSSSMGADYSTRFDFPYEHYLEGTHSLTASVDFVPKTVTTGGGGGERQLGGNLSHNWQVHEDLNINTRLQLRNSQTELLQGNALQRNNSTFLLGSSNFSWKPFEEEPLSVSGGASVTSIQTDTGVGMPLIAQQSFSGNVGAGYVFNKNLTAGAGLSGSMSSSGTARSSALNGNAYVNYDGDPLKFGSFDYTWNLGGGLDGALSSPGAGSLGARATGRHSLNRTIIIDPRQSVGLNASQGVSVNVLQKKGSVLQNNRSVVSLANSAGANWGASYGSSFSTAVSGSVSHSVTSGSGNNQAVATNLSGNANYNHPFSARANGSLFGNITWTTSMFGNVQSQTLNQVNVGGRQGQLTGSVQAAYNHNAPFSVPNLHYNATAFWNVSQSGGAVAGAGADAGKLNTSASLQQNLRYRVGRLSFNLNAAVINSGTQTSYSIFGSVNREFDGFFDGRW